MVEFRLWLSFDDRRPRQLHLDIADFTNFRFIVSSIGNINYFLMKNSLLRSRIVEFLNCFVLLVERREEERVRWCRY